MIWEMEIDGRVEGPFDTATARRMLARRPGLLRAPMRMARADLAVESSGPGPWRTPLDFGFGGQDEASDPDAPATTRGLERRALWLRGALFLMIAASAGWVLSSIYSLYFFYRIRNTGLGAAPEAMMREANLIDTVAGAVGLVFLVAVVVGMLSYCFWVNRAARHARQLRPDVMTISPDWAVGWCFVPVANLWMPFKAVSQIWRATAASGAALPAEPSPVLWLWWAPYVASNVLSNASLRLDLRGDSQTAEQAIWLDIASDGLSIVACGALLAVVSRITAAQRAWNPAKVFE